MHVLILIVACVASLHTISGQPSDGDIRGDTTNPANIRLDVYYNGSWGSICRTNFSTTSAGVACRSLDSSFASGFSIQSVTRWKYAPGVGQILLDDVICNGTENSLLECSRRNWGTSDCSHSEDVSIKCNGDITGTPNPPNGTTGSLRLSGSFGQQNVGRLEVYYNGAWGTVCDDFFDANDNAATVSCRSLGFRDGGERYFFANGTEPIWLTNVTCLGTEQTIADCPKSDYGSVGTCTHNLDVVVSCNFFTTIPSTTTPIPTQYPPTCPLNGNELTGSTGTLGSPSYPLNYQNSVNCRWRILSTVQQVFLEFLAFRTEANYDFVYLYNGYSEIDDLIIRLSGLYTSPLPGPYTTTQSYMYIRFTTDPSVVYTGFEARYTSVSDSTGTTPAAGGACSADDRPLRLTGYTGTFTSPSYPRDYFNDADCQWQIESGYLNGFVRLDFTAFYTETCCDFAFVYDGVSIKAPLIASLSGAYSTLPAAINSTQRYMYIRFRTDATFTATGFTARYTSIGGDPCDPNSDPLELAAYSGTFTSANYPGNYPDDAICEWRIVSAESNGFVQMDFTFFSTEECCDALILFDGDSVKASRIALLSGSLVPPPTGLNSTQKFMFVRFSSDSSGTARGFNATYTSRALPVTECGSILRVSPNTTNVAPGWGPSCYISAIDDVGFIDTPCRDLIKDLPPGIGDYSSLLTRGGNFGCGTTTRDDFLGADFVCADNYQQTLTLRSSPLATKMIVCIRLPTQ